MTERQRAFLQHLSTAKRIYWAGVEELAFSMFGTNTSALTKEQTARLCNAVSLLQENDE